MFPSPYIVGITGSSGSGKTSVAQALQNLFGSGNSLVISEDNFHSMASNVNLQSIDPQDQEALKEFEIFLKKLKSGQKSSIRCYNFKSKKFCRYKGNTHLTYPSKKIIIIEGLLIFSHAQILKLYNSKIFLDTSLETCLSRRLNRYESKYRDSEKRRWEIVSGQFKRDILPQKEFADQVIKTEDKKPLEISQVILSKIKT
ncbi:MAG: AAA family ATPase [Patescibacteria group bacterium]|nr:AAA family ATPase [Patescibacteria group bacterium]